MFTHTTKILLCCLLTIFSIKANSQATVTANSNIINLPCGGGPVNLTAVGNSTTTVLGSNFDNGSVGAGWNVSAAGQFNNPCGPGLNGTTHMWMGSTTAAPRTMETASLDVSCGGEICFDFKMSAEGVGDVSPCEGPDSYNEGVNLQYSTDGGATWIDIAYMAPNGDLLVSNPGTWSPYASGTTAWTSWTNLCFPIPAGAETTNTIFQWYQSGSSGSGFDHWGIDEVTITAQTCNPYYYDWTHIPGSPDAANVTANPTQTTTYTVHYTNGIDDTVTAQVTVIVDGVELLTLNTVEEACLGDNNATASVTATGGTNPYSFQLTGPVNQTNASGNFSGLSPGLYTITVTDQAACFDDTSFTINPGPPCCTTTANSQDATCNGGCDGTGTATPSGGTAPYTYQWFDNAGNPIAGATNQTETNFCAGNYSVTITDATNCTASANITVGEPTVVTVADATTPALCNGACDGTLTLTAGGGTGPYTYSIDGGLTFQNSNVFNGLCAGNFNVVVADANNCQATMVSTIIEPLVLAVSETGNISSTCGNANGEFTVTAADGTAPYTYDLAGNTNNTGNFTGLLAGAYTVDVTDANNCTVSINVTVIDAGGPTAFIDTQNGVTCAGGLNGSFTVGVTGGTAPYQYSIDGVNFQASNAFPSVGAGLINVTVQDVNNCQATTQLTIVEPTPLTYNVVINPATCNGVCDGEIVVTAQGANAPYQYSSDNGLTFQASNTLAGLCAGNVDVVVQDNNGCLANSIETMTEPTALNANFSITDAICNGSCDGQIDVTASNGTPGYTYSIDNGISFQPGTNFSGLCAGNYDMVVQDNNGCQFNSTETVGEPVNINITVLNSTPSNCGNNDGDFIVSATLGAAPYQYSIDYGVNQQGNGFFQNIAGGLYTVHVEDGNGCTDTLQVGVSDLQLVTTLNLTVDADCFNAATGSAILSSVNGAPPVVYSLNGGATQPSGVFGGIPAGNHIVTVTDNGLCIDNIQFTITHPDSVTFTNNTTDISCFGGNDGSIEFINILGGDGAYTYSIDNGGTFQASPNFNGLTAGTYDLVVMDGNNCLGATSVTLTEPTQITISTNNTDLTCNGNNTGFIQIVANNGTPGYQYSIDGGANYGTNFNFPLLAAGNYNVNVQDNNGCVVTTTATLNEPAVITATFAVTDPLCNGGTDGQIVVTAAGGTPAYQYSSDNGTTLQSSNTLTGLSAGAYTMHIQDDNGCIYTEVQNVGEPTLVTFNMTSVPATCGNNNAEVTVIAANGTPGYTYSSDGVNYVAGNNIIGLSPINYDIYVQDNNGCIVSQNINLSADPLPQIDLISITEPLCNGSADGTITINASGGVGALTFSYDNGNTFQGANNLTGLTSGIYDIVVQDANGCTNTQQVTLTDPAVLTATATPTDLLCNNDFTGAVDVLANGGTAPYTYSFDNGGTYQGGNVLNFIATGTYDVVVQDANGCTSTDQVIVNEPAALSWQNFIVLDASCWGLCDGQVNAIVSGGTVAGVYQYNWSNGLAPTTSSQAVNVCAGTYSVIVTDDNGCQIDSLNFILNEPPLVTINSVIADSTLCNGTCDGQITIDAPVATQFSIDGGVNFSTNNVFTGLCAGNYDIEVQDANGCVATSNTTLYEPNALSISVPTSSTICQDSIATISAFVNGGTLPYAYNWNTGNQTQNFDQIITTQSNFTVDVIDANNCPIGPISYTLDIPPALILTVSPDVQLCPGNSTSINMSATGGEPLSANNDYEYLWTTTGDTLLNINVNPSVSTYYTAQVTDLCGVTVTDSVLVDFYNEPQVLISSAQDGCTPVTVTLNNTTNSIDVGTNCIWNMGDGTIINDCASVSHTYSTPGCYDVTLTVTSPDGCVGDSTFANHVCVFGNPIAEFSFNPTDATVVDPMVDFTNLSSGDSSYVWDFDGLATSTFENPSHAFPSASEGVYNVCLEVTSADGCKDTICYPVEILDDFNVFCPNSFSPEGDGVNDFFFPIVNGHEPDSYELYVFDRWGSIVFESRHTTQSWDGTLNGYPAKEDVYVWKIKVQSKYDAESKVYYGHVTLIR